MYDLNQQALYEEKRNAARDVLREIELGAMDEYALMRHAEEFRINPLPLVVRLVVRIVVAPFAFLWHLMTARRAREFSPSRGTRAPLGKYTVASK